MTHRLITQPSIITIASPRLHAEGIGAFLEQEGLEQAAAKHGTPANRLLDHVANGSVHSDAERLVEFAGRQCYRSFKAGRDLPEYMQNIIETEHGSVVAHAHFTFHLSGISRAMSLELNRHNVGIDLSQESQRFVDAKTVKFVVPPALLDIVDGDLECGEIEDWYGDQVRQIDSYVSIQNLILAEASAMEAKALETKDPADIKAATMVKKRANEAARYSLPQSCETKMAWTANIRSLRYILGLRGAYDADLEIRRFAVALAPLCRKLAPTLFPDVLTVFNGDFGVPTVSVAHPKI